MSEQFSRTESLIGTSGVKKLKTAGVLVCGIGGVGGYVAETLARAGVGTLGLCDGDVFCLSNLNRQLYATHKTLGVNKARAAAKRIRDIDPDTAIHTYEFFYSKDSAVKIDLSAYDYIVDAIDNVTAKIELILAAQRFNVPIVSCMGAGNKLDPAGFTVADIYETSVCPLAKVMRSELKKRGVTGLTVVYSKETPVKLRGAIDPCNAENTDDLTSAGASAQDSIPPPRIKQIPGSISFVPAAAGLVLAGKVVSDLLVKP